MYDYKIVFRRQKIGLGVSEPVTGSTRKHCPVCCLTQLHPLFKGKEVIYKTVSCLMIEHLPATVWATDTFITHSAMVSQSFIHHWLTEMVSWNQYSLQLARSMCTHIRCDFSV